MDKSYQFLEHHHIEIKITQYVWERDFGRCVLCGSINAGPHCHYIRRSQGGLGIPENIWTGCQRCHAAFDNEGADGPLHKQMQDYLRTLYPGWDESKLIYKKEGPKC